ncbi:MAG: hypothetical protein Ct9H300mP8_12700 [Gammaproteobacteria bacterium]|nr:MAG: hypothetical protein Ct9H300mP8_12700 [Gammaproteobacteria bacterium]
MTGKIVGIAIATRSGAGAYIPLGHEEPEQLDRELVVKRLAPLLEDSKILKTGHDLNFPKGNVFALDDVGLPASRMTQCFNLSSSTASALGDISSLICRRDIRIHACSDRLGRRKRCETDSLGDGWG